MASDDTGQFTWRVVAALAPALTAGDWATLACLGTLPWLTATHLRALSGVTASGPVRARLTRLHRRGLLQATPTRGMRQVERQAARQRPDGRDDATVWALTDVGLAALAWRHGTDPRRLAARYGLTAARQTALLLALPQVSAAYDLLAALCRARPGRPLLLDWAQPWPARPVWTLPGQPGRLTQMAALTLGWTDDGVITRERLRAWLLPDTGQLPVAALAPVLRRIARASSPNDAAPIVVVATTDHERRAAWQARLVTLDAPSLVVTWGDVGAGRLALPTTRPSADDRSAAAPAWPVWRPRGGSRTIPCLLQADPGPLAGVPATALARTGALLPRPAREALLLLAAHPFLPLATWAALRGQAVGRFRAREVAPLLAAAMVRTLTAGEAPGGSVDGATIERLELIEATAAGLTLLAAQAGVGLSAAVRWAGWAGGGPIIPVGPRRSLLITLAHTLGIYRLLAALHRPLATHRFAPDDALIEWLPGSARRWRGIRPDAFGRARHLGREYPFFLEYERGGNPPAQVTAKLLAYERYAERGEPARAGHARMPALLVVAADAAGEARTAGLAAALWPDPARAVPLLLTTEPRLLADDAGWLGRIWRASWSIARRYWPWEVERQASPRR